MAVSLQSADQFVSFAISMLAMQLNKRPFMLDPKVIFILRVAFVVSMLSQALIAFYTRKRIMKTNDQKKFKLKNEPTLFGTPENQEEEVEMSYYEYDLNETNKMLRGSLLQGLVIGLIHYKWKVTQPLMIQATGLLRNLFFNSLYRAHVFGMEVLRPFDRNLLFSTAAVDTPAPTDASVQEKKKKKEE